MTVEKILFTSYRTRSIKDQHSVLNRAPAAVAEAAIGVLVFNITENEENRRGIRKQKISEAKNFKSKKYRNT